MDLKKTLSKEESKPMIDLYAYIDIDLEILGEAPAVIVSVSVWDFEEVGNYY